jgi:hypothetical protein
MALTAGMALTCVAHADPAAISPLHKVGDDRIRQTMIQQSQHGTCPCPYSLDTHSHPCKGHSQYKRLTMNHRPLCYATDVSDDMVQAWRTHNNVRPPVP